MANRTKRVEKDPSSFKWFKSSFADTGAAYLAKLNQPVGDGTALSQNGTAISYPYCVDPGGQAGVLLPDGTFVLHGRHKKTGMPIKSYTMEHVLRDLEMLPPGPIRIEGARTANKTGLTPEFAQRLAQLGFGPLTTCNTRDAYKERALVCASGHDKKPEQELCDDCTINDLQAMAKRPDNYFYPLRFDRPKTNKLAAAEYKLALNDDRFDSPPYKRLSEEAPAWVLAKYEDVVAATIFRGAQIGAKYKMTQKECIRLIGLHQHARRCQSYANIAICKYDKNKLRADARLLLSALRAGPGTAISATECFSLTPATVGPIQYQSQEQVSQQWNRNLFPLSLDRIAA